MEGDHYRITDKDQDSLSKRGKRDSWKKGERGGRRPSSVRERKKRGKGIEKARINEPRKELFRKGRRHQ